MSQHYLHFNIFGLALASIAVGSGSRSRRLQRAYMGYLFKLEWENDLNYIPVDSKKDFLQLKKILHDDVLVTIQKEREEIRKQYTASGLKVTEMMLGDRSNSRIVIDKFHWTKAQKAIELICSIYFGLGLELRNK